MPKKILYLITQSDFGGAQRYVYDLATSISKNFTAVVAGGEQGYAGELAKKLQEKNIRYVCLSHLKRAINPRHDFLVFWQIVKLIKQERPDIIHLNSSKISILGSLAAQFIRIFAIRRLAFHSQISIIYTVHGWVFNEDLPAWQEWFYKTAERFTAYFKDKIICLSEFEKNNTIKNNVAPTEKISVIYNGREAIDFLPREQAREKLGIPRDAFVIGAIGNLNKNKGYEYLIKAVKKLQILDFKLQIVIIGQGLEFNNLKSKILNLKLSDKIKIMGNIPDAAKLLPAFDLYVCSSVKEGLPYTILEAMQAGLPIVTTTVGAIPEVVTDKKNGLLVEPKNPQALAEKIQYLIDHPDVAKKLGEQAQEDVREKFSLERMVEETEKIYRQ
ncbi:MAG: glycosyltransferase family 4 protein [Patescibacteria group bacterium]|jgi:glycosyltransferase involved in cell wall biosynthesis